MPRPAAKKTRAAAPKRRQVTSYEIGTEDRAFIAAQVKAGAFPNATAVMRAALAAYREQTERELAWDAAIQAGLESPIDPRPAREVLAEIRRKHFG
jgi:putative addiction module CopG family antidote